MFCFYVIVVIAVFAVTISVAVVNIAINIIYDAGSVAVDVSASVGYFCCNNSAVKILCTVITTPMVASVSETTFNVTKYVNILISVIVGF